MIGQIESAIIDRIKANATLQILGYVIRQVDSLPADVDERLSEVITDFPAAWTYLGAMRATGQAGRSTKMEAAVSVICAAKNLRSERAARFGAGDREVGSYQIAHDVAAMLMGQTLGLEMDPLELAEIAPLYSSARAGKERVSLMGARFTARFWFEPAGGEPGERGLGDFATFDAAWLPGGDLTTHDHVTIPIQEPGS
jgi:phage gp37-like protein